MPWSKITNSDIPDAIWNTYPSQLQNLHRYGSPVMPGYQNPRDQNPYIQETAHITPYETKPKKIETPSGSFYYVDAEGNYDPTKPHWASAKDMPFNRPGWVTAFYGWNENPEQIWQEIDKWTTDKNPNKKNREHFNADLRAYATGEGSQKDPYMVKQQQLLTKYLNTGTKPEGLKTGFAIDALDYSFREMGRNQQHKGGFWSSFLDQINPINMLSLQDFAQKMVDSGESACGDWISCSIKVVKEIAETAAEADRAENLTGYDRGAWVLRHDGKDKEIVTPEYGTHEAGGRRVNPETGEVITDTPYDRPYIGERSIPETVLTTPVINPTTGREWQLSDINPITQKPFSEGVIGVAGGSPGPKEHRERNPEVGEPVGDDKVTDLITILIGLKKVGVTLTPSQEEIIVENTDGKDIYQDLYDEAAAGLAAQGRGEGGEGGEGKGKGEGEGEGDGTRNRLGQLSISPDTFVGGKLDPVFLGANKRYNITTPQSLAKLPFAGIQESYKFNPAFDTKAQLGSRALTPYDMGTVPEKQGILERFRTRNDHHGQRGIPASVLTTPLANQRTAPRVSNILGGALQSHQNPLGDKWYSSFLEKDAPKFTLEGREPKGSNRQRNYQWGSNVPESPFLGRATSKYSPPTSFGSRIGTISKPTLRQRELDRWVRSL